MRNCQDVVHPASLTRVTVHKVAIGRRLAVAAFLVALYAAAGLFIYNTIGDPYALAVAEAEKHDEAAWDAFQDMDDVLAPSSGDGAWRRTAC